MLVGVPSLRLGCAVMQPGGASVCFGFLYKPSRRLCIDSLVGPATRDPFVLARSALTLPGASLAIARAADQH